MKLNAASYQHSERLARDFSFFLVSSHSPIAVEKLENFALILMDGKSARNWTFRSVYQIHRKSAEYA